jgi:peptide-methionine (S)-S-oxide reductase
MGTLETKRRRRTIERSAAAAPPTRKRSKFDTTPTQLNRQGNDMGRQYRSAVFFADDEQKQIAESYIRQLNEARVFHDPIATTIEPLETFYAAEEYHQDYAARNPQQPYVVYVAQPKVEKLRENFADRLKK